MSDQSLPPNRVGDRIGFLSPAHPVVPALSKDESVSFSLSPSTSASPVVLFMYTKPKTRIPSDTGDKRKRFYDTVFLTSATAPATLSFASSATAASFACSSWILAQRSLPPMLFRKLHQLRYPPGSGASLVY